MMRNILIIIKREYLTRVRSKAFVIGTFLSPLFILALAILPTFLADRSKGSRSITVFDLSGDEQFFSEIKNRLESQNRKSLFSTTGNKNDGQDASLDEKRGLGNLQFTLTRVVVQEASQLADLMSEPIKRIEQKSNEAVLVIPKEALSGQPLEYYAKNPSDLAVAIVESTINDVIKERRLAQAGFNKANLEEYLKPVQMQRRNPRGEEEKGIPRFAVGMVMLFFIYITTLFYGIFVMRGVIEEKQSRIVEVLISSVKPFELMMGKLIGIGLVGLTQYAIWILCLALVLVFGASVFVNQGIPLPQIPISLIIYFVLFFILGYFLYASLYALVGAIVSNEEDAQQVQMPVTLLVVVPVILFPLVMTNPDSTLSTILSMIPFFAPTLMMMRVAMINPPIYQVALAMVGMLITILASVWMVGRIYRIGILMYGKRPSLIELGRWIRYS
ncbi:MAG: ABC transporter permease [Acidobacteriota bacterium]